MSATPQVSVFVLDGLESPPLLSGESDLIMSAVDSITGLLLSELDDLSVSQAPSAIEHCTFIRYMLTVMTDTRLGASHKCLIRISDAWGENTSFRMRKCFASAERRMKALENMLIVAATCVSAANRIKDTAASVLRGM